METRQYTEDIDFKKYWLILKRRWLPASTVFIFTVALAAAFAFLKKPTYEAEGRLLFKKQNTTSALVTEAGAKIGQLEPLNVLNTPLDTEAEIVRSEPLIQETINSLNLKDKKGDPLKPADFLKQLTVKGIKGTDVLQISVKGKDPEEAAKIVNKLMDLYREKNVLNNRAQAAAAREFISKQLPKTEATVRQAEAALRSFKEQNNIVALEEEGSSAVKAIAELDSKKAQTQAELEDATARVAAFQSKIGLNSQRAMALNSLSQSPAVQQVLIELQKIEGELTVERTRFQDENPKIINLESKQAALKALLQERVGEIVGTNQQVSEANLQIGELEQKLTAELVNAEVQRLGLANQVTFLSRAQEAYKQRANILPRLQQGQRDLQRQVEAAQSTYQILLKNLQEVQIAENQNVGNASLISAATVPEKPVGTRKLIIIAAGIVAGSLLYVITAFLVDLKDPTIKTAKEVRELFKYTVLGMIPSLKKKVTFRSKKLERILPQLPVRDHPHSVISEAYRMLQANLKFLSPDQELKVIAVTSSVSKEGKSTVCANLAIAMAQLGRRVLLIDADLHHPMQHHIWDLTNAIGLSDVIVNQAEFEMAVREVMDNLDVLPSGVIPPNPLALVDSKRMAGLIDNFSKDYDFIILDTPPIVLVADALAVGKMTDGMLLVVRPGVVDTVSAAACKQFLVQSGQKVLGLVVNGVIVENEPDSYFHHAKAYYKEDASTPKMLTAKAPKNSDRV
ncbi:polysaccharide biosynthesis tyrosine autokinase [Coleofasciculus sp. FACHB-129]|uniref:GumC family protein n=1 Tax=Cyanophyceae TaxID=3028117 RepID=UPI00168218E9|nr:polysaccharide biosynthesis tyrosine autokinase [Coleofasciculus sp. FACHB-129]MBD1897442.1 polysaccharide biosynthesis tyrosine autokinase [Coleofasciculus sp. FACHB-129]